MIWSDLGTLVDKFVPAGKARPHPEILRSHRIDGQNPNRIDGVCMSFFLSWVSKTQPNHWTKRMANTSLAT